MNNFKLILMKYFLTKQSLFLILISFFFVFVSCNEDDQTECCGDESDSTDLTAEAEGDPLSIEEIYNTVDKAKFPQNWTYDYIYDHDLSSSISAAMADYDDIDIVKDQEFEDSIYFVWKFDLQKIKILCVSTFGMYAKGGSYLYNLVSYDEEFNKIDELFFAGLWAVSVENPYGGTSAGEDYQTALLEYKNGTLHINTDEAAYHIDEKGQFVKEDSKETVPLSEFKQMFKDIGTFPFRTNEAVFSEVHSSENQLKSGHVRTLFKNGMELEDLHGKWSVESFYKIDSIKDAGTYEAFMNSYPDGTVRSLAAPLYKLHFNANIVGYLWGISESSADKCPSFDGINIYLSLVDGEEVISSCLIAESSAGGDPPYWSETEISATIYEDARIEIDRVIKSGGDEEEDEEIIEKSYVYQYSKGKISPLN
jgi:hypothetical protein